MMRVFRPASPMPGRKTALGAPPEPPPGSLDGEPEGAEEMEERA